MPFDEKRVILTNKGKDFLRDLRIKQGLPKLFDKSYPTIVKWENGKNNPTLNIFEKYISSFKLSLNELKENGFIEMISPSIRQLAIQKTTKIPKEKYNLLIEEHRKGLTLEKIAKKYNCTASNVFYILKKCDIDTSKHGSGEKYSFPASAYIKYLIKQGINKEDVLPLISSLLLTDGCLYFDKKRPVTLYYGTDVILHNIFADLIWYYFNLRPSSYMTRCGKVFRTKYINKNIASKLLTLSHSYKKKPNFNETWKNFLNNSKQPSLFFMKNYDDFIVKEAIRLAMCADGCISISNRKKRKTTMLTLMLSCAHPSLVKEWAILFNRIGIKNNIVRGMSKTRIAGVKGVKDSILRFNEIGGFINGVKVCVHASPLYGIEKQKILSIVANLLKKYRRINTIPISFEEFKSLL